MARLKEGGEKKGRGRKDSPIICRVRFIQTAQHNLDKSLLSLVGRGAQSESLNAFNLYLGVGRGAGELG